MRPRRKCQRGVSMGKGMIVVSGDQPIRLGCDFVDVLCIVSAEQKAI